MRPRFAEPIRASSPSGLHQQAGHMTASDLPCCHQQSLLPGGGHQPASAARLRRSSWGVVAPTRLPRVPPASIPVVRFLCAGSSDGYAPHARAFRDALQGAGFIDNQNVKIEYRWANDRYGRLRDMAVRTRAARRVCQFVAAGGAQTVLAAKAATNTIPIVFQNGSDYSKTWTGSKSQSTGWKRNGSVNSERVNHTKALGTNV